MIVKIMLLFTLNKSIHKQAFQWFNIHNKCILHTQRKTNNWENILGGDLGFTKSEKNKTETFGLFFNLNYRKFSFQAKN